MKLKDLPPESYFVFVPGKDEKLIRTRVLFYLTKDRQILEVRLDKLRHSRTKRTWILTPTFGGILPDTAYLTSSVIPIETYE